MILFNIVDIIDIAALAFIIYEILIFIKNSRANQMLIGLLFVFSMVIIANIFNMIGLKWLAGQLKNVWLVAFFIIFQHELRSAVNEIGKVRVFKFITKKANITIIEKLVKATLQLKDRGIGAIIVITKNNILSHVEETGVKLDSAISEDLITTIFTPYSPLHDGAIIIRDGKIVAASCILPLSEKPSIGYNFGTRHRAAIGITEVSDSISIIVSEETRMVSVAYMGRLKTDLDKNELIEYLKELIS
jgi:uncharacterized protein (TIGR00159 family)